jgi:hypothetical protein
LHAVWVEAEQDGTLVFHQATQRCTAPPSVDNDNGVLRWWAIDFETPRGAFFVHNTGWNAANGTCEFWNGRYTAYGDFFSAQTANHSKERCSFAPGAPATFTLRFNASLDRLAPGERLTLLNVSTGYVLGGIGPLVVDQATPIRAYERPPAAPSVGASNATAPAGPGGSAPSPPLPSPTPAADPASVDSHPTTSSPRPSPDPAPRATPGVSEATAGLLSVACAMVARRRR